MRLCDGRSYGRLRLLLEGASVESDWQGIERSHVTDVTAVTVVGYKST